MAWLCCLASSGVEPPAIVALARIAADVKGDDDRAVALNTLGAALYRAGDDAGAIGRIEEGIRLRKGAESPQDSAFLALAHARLGHASDARRDYARLVAWRQDDDPSKFFDNLEILLLRREAESAVRPDVGFPSLPIHFPSR